MTVPQSPTTVSSHLASLPSWQRSSLSSSQYRPREYGWSQVGIQYSPSSASDSNSSPDP